MASFLDSIGFALTPTSLMMLGSAVAAGVAVFLLVRSLWPERFVQEVQEQRRLAPTSPADPARRQGAVRAFGEAFIAKVGRYNARFVDKRPAFQEKLRTRFIAMGRPDFKAQDFVAHQWIWAFFFGLLGLMLMNMLGKSLLFAIPFLAFGAGFPYVWLADQVKKRQAALSRALPYHIDLLTLSVEAGLDFQAAMGTVVEKGRPGPLIEEIGITLGEIKLGKTRAEALRNFANRVQMPDVSAFVSNLIQADQMGTSLGKVLRIQTNQMRVARTQRAEKLANEAPVKMLLPLIGCIFPTVFLILFGPIVYRLFFGGGP